MLRKLHSLPSLVIAVFLIVLASSGAILSLQPSMDRAKAIVPARGEVNVAALAQHIVSQHPKAQIQKIERTLSGDVIAFYQNSQNQMKSDLINPLTGATMAAYHPSAFMRWVKDIHRSFLMGKAGRGVAGAMSFAMVMICLSGVFLLVRRLGGWKALFKPMSGSGRKRFHSEVARFAVMGLLLSSLTGAYMSAVRFGWLPDHTHLPPAFPDQVSGGTPAPVGTLKALINVDLNDLRSLVFPYPGDPQDFFTVTTMQGTGFVDQANGQLLNYRAFPKMNLFQTWILRLHTGEGLWWLGLILGASALTVPVLSYTGILVWWQRRKSGPRLKSVDAKLADHVILVGTEGNTTWGFARELQANLSKAGCKVHCAKMSQLATAYPKAKRLFILTSTYGNGDAPTSAHQFLDKLKSFQSHSGLKYAVLGFGDRQFPSFCQYAQDVAQAMQAKGMTRLLDLELVDRCSATQFKIWGESLSAVTGLHLQLNHNPQPVPTTKLTLIAREDYGVNTQAATSIFRFTLAEPEANKLPKLGRKAPSLPFFEAGDLLGIVPPSEHIARFYSLASSQSDGVVEICVRKQPGGVCSGYLHNLQLGDCIEGFVRHNPEFRPAVGTSPIILIGAGAGIGPLAGFIRKNTQRNPMYLYWGGRNPDGDFLYKPDLKRYLYDQRLTKLRTAFSQTKEGIYVQDKLLQDQKAVRQMIAKGAQILVCGGRGMANGVSQVINDIVKPMHLDVHTLKAQGRYLEDVY